MTYPYDPAASGDQQPAWGDPQYGQPGGGAPYYGQQPGGGAPQYGHPGAPAPFGEPAPFLQPAQPTQPPRRNRRLAASVAAVVVIGGGAATYVAVSSSDAASGAASPKAAVQTLMTDLGNSDLVGVLDDLPPGERAAIAQPLERTISLLKKNDVIEPDANLTKVSGIVASVSGLTYADKTITINDHVQIVQLTGGKISFSADAAKLPITQDFLRAVAPHGAPAPTASSIDISKIVASSGRPVRLATQESGGRWYPSLLYTVADNIVTARGLTAPSAADRIPAKGAATPDDAVRGFVEAALNADPEAAAELLSPDELAVLHDYGKLILDKIHYSKPNITLKDLEFTDTTYSGGVRVEVKSVDVVTPDGTEVKVSINGSCVDVTSGTRSKHLCTSQLLDELHSVGSSLTPAQQKALSDVFSGLTNVAGLDVTQSGGSWYLSPVQSIFDVVNALLSGLKGDDMKQLLSLASH